MYQTHQELIRRQQHKLEKSYIILTPGTPVWVQHRQNTSWEPATVMSQCTTNSYWIMHENVSSDLVQPTVPTPDTQASASFDSKSEEREEIADTPAPALERTEEQSTHTPGSRKSTRKNFGKPASSFSDFYM